jgi:hypothetical protein
MKKLTILVAALFLVATASGMAMAYTYADQVITMIPTPMGAPNHASNMNMNWFYDPGSLYTDPNPYNDRLLGVYDQYAVGWGPGGGTSPWTGTANAIVQMAQPFTHDGKVADRPLVAVTDSHTPQNFYPQNPAYDIEETQSDDYLSGLGYDLVIYGLGYGFDAGFESAGQINVWVSETLSDNINDWTLVSGWSGDPNGYDGEGDYFLNQDGTFKLGGPFFNGGKPAWSHTYMTIDLDNPLIVERVDEDGRPVYEDIGPIDGEFNYIWFEGGYYEDDEYTHGNANFIDAFGANPVPIPGAVWLLGSGLLGLIGIRRKKS